MLLFRALLFYTVFNITAVIVGLVGLPLSLLPYRIRGQWFITFNRVVIWSLRWICGVKIHIRGIEHLKQDAPVVIMAKHQSTWETMFLQLACHPVSTILKKELLRVPFFGWGLAALRPIAIDRSNPKAALKMVKEMGEKRLAQGNNLLIFPEGTRTPVGQVGNYARSAADIAISAGVPILPIAHNGGVHWPMHDIRKYPGTIEVVIGAPINPEGRNSKQLTEEVKNWIEGEIASMPVR